MRVDVVIDDVEEMMWRSTMLEVVFSFFFFYRKMNEKSV